MRRYTLPLIACLLLGGGRAAEPLTDDQALAANVANILTALDLLKSPLTGVNAQALQAAIKAADGDKLQALLDQHVLVTISINPESRVKAARGDAKPELRQSATVPFLVKVVNDAGVTARLGVTSPQAASSGGFLETKVHAERPLAANLTGRPVQYALLLVKSSEAGKREATLAFDAGQGTQDLGFRAEVAILFTIRQK